MLRCTPSTGPARFCRGRGLGTVIPSNLSHSGRAEYGARVGPDLTGSMAIDALADDVSAGGGICIFPPDGHNLLVTF